GLITDDQGTTLDQFDGVVYIKVYDKTANIVSLNNDGEGHHSFKLQNQIIFKGKSRVRKGRFQTTFIVPKDIRLDFGLGKISYYAIEDNTLNDASGFETTIIGGINKNAPVDDQGPDIRLYLNDEQFVDGGLTDSEPLFYAELFDESGINTVGSGIGHDMALKIDGNPDAIILNDAYESNLDDFQRGIVKYRLSELEDGEHFLEFKAWDTHNNSGTAKLSFVVANNNEIAIDHILNYPNPFTTNTSFYFDHNQAGRDLDVSIDVMTISGKRIKSFKHTGYQKGNRFGPIPWDGRDEYGDLIGKGVYIYKVSVTNELGLREDKFEKLVLLK
ncbi:MAG: peptidase C25, partial [Flavobacteriales bacterium]|nr:peptidase C25 [Flavobacteriales bacterium]